MQCANKNKERKMEFKPLPEQAEIINSKNKNLLVSASAGSGKTTVMIERICKLIADGLTTPKNLLVMTFTTSAASEMKQKLYNALKSKVDDPEILDEIATSDISTIHSFCSRLIKKYFYVLGVSPNFEIADEKKSLKIKKEVIFNILTNFAVENAKQYFELMQNFAPNRKNDNIVEIVLKLDEYSQSFENKQDFYEKMLYLYNNPKICLDFENQYLKQNILNIKIKAEQLQKKFECLDALNYCKYLNEIMGQLATISDSFDFFDNFENICKISLPQLKKDDNINYDLFLELDRLKSQIKNFVTKCKNKKIVQKNNFEFALEKNKELCKILLEFLQKFDEEYNHYKSQNCIMDYSDLEQYALKLCQNPKKSEELKQNYKYVFVDEYQDTNTIQNKLVDLLCGQDNKFLVGDVKQSIYGFRRSKPKIFLDIEKQYKTDDFSEAKYLNVNFRSDKQILNFVNFVFENIMTVDTSGIDYKENGKFKGIKSSDNSLPKIKICTYQKKEDKKQKILARGVYKVQAQPETSSLTSNELEACIVAKQIVDLIGKKLDDGKAVQYSDITILVRKRGDGYNQFCDRLSALGLPIYASNSADILQNPEAEKFLNLLKLCTNINDDIALVSTLVGYFDFDEQFLCDIRLASSEYKYFYECLKNFGNNKKIDFFYTNINQLKSNMNLLGANKALKMFFSDIRYFERLEAMHAKMQKDIVNILLEQLLDPEYNFNIPKFLENVLHGGKLNLPDRKSDDSNFVNVTTIHSSKGLEYPIVFLVDSGADFNKSKSEIVELNDEFGMGFKYFDVETQTAYDDVVLSAIKHKNKQEEFAEKLRLLYVATTRAKHMLCIVGACDYDNIVHKVQSFDIQNETSFMELVLSSFEQEVLDKMKTEQNFVWASKDFEVCFEKFSYDFESASLKEKYIFSKGDDKLCTMFENRLNQKFATNNIALKNSVSGIMKSENPYENMVESVQTLTIDEHLRNQTSQEQGVFFHKLLQVLEYKDFDNIQKIKDAIAKYSELYEGVFVDAELVANAMKILNDLFGQAKVNKEKSFVLQVPYNKVVESDLSDLVLVQGVIDAFALTDDGAILVDFKFSKTKSDVLIKRYKKQLDLYALAINQAYNKQKIQKYILNLNYGQLVKVE